jgi:hypothetical protein
MYKDDICTGTVWDCSSHNFLNSFLFKKKHKNNFFISNINTLKPSEKY